MHAAGFENAVATLGTAITSEQARIFAKHTKKVIICYDADNAGQTAASKAMRLLGEVGVDVRVLKIPGAKDPDEYIKKYGVESFKRALGESKTGFDHNLEKIVSAHNIELAEEKIKAASECATLISGTAYTQVELELYVRKAAERLGVSFDALLGDVKRTRARMERERKQKQSAEAQMTVKNLNNRTNPEAAKNVKASKAEETILGLMLVFEDLRHYAACGQANISSEDFVTDFGRRVFDSMCELENSEGGFSKAMLEQSFDLDEISLITRMEIERTELIKNDKEVFDASVISLKAERSKIDSQSNGNDPFAELRAKQAELRNRKKQDK
jgi:DNA primase